MSAEFYCDFCGQVIEGKLATIEAGGHPSPVWIKIDRFDFCAGTREDHADSCFELARKGLSDMKRWAHRGEGSPLEWTLAERSDSAGGSVPEVPAPIEPVAPIKGELFLERAGIKHPRSLQALRAGGVRTLEEAADHTEWELRSMDGVGATTFENVAAAMAEHGLDFQPGPSGADAGARIRALRTAAGMSQSGLAKAIDPREDGERWRSDRICAPDIGAWEKGHKGCPAKWLQRIADPFGVPVEHFLEPVPS